MHQLIERYRPKSYLLSIAPRKSFGRSIRNNLQCTSTVDYDGLTPLDLMSKVSGISSVAVAAARIMQMKGSTSDISDSSGDSREVLVMGRCDFHCGILLPDALDLSHPRVIKSLSSLSVAALSAAKYHSVALTAAGHVYTWGIGRDGRLGHADQHTQPYPALVLGLSHLRVTCIAAAENHMLAVTSNGALFAWGSNRFGQLGTGGDTTTPLLEPRQVSHLRRSHVSLVAAGLTHSVCSTTTGDIYAWYAFGSYQRHHKPLVLTRTQYVCV